ncbi:MAG: hypothetical protein ACRD40_01490 [Candidatus Acidiferrales bacterium]
MPKPFTEEWLREIRSAVDSIRELRKECRLASCRSGERERSCTVALSALQEQLGLRLESTKAL